MNELVWRNFSGIYLFICLADIVSITFFEHYSFLEFIFKPLIMLPIIGVAYKQLKTHFLYKTILFAFVFSWLGDVFLLGQAYSEWFFVAGLGSFLISHLLYSRYFLLSVNMKFNSQLSIKIIQLIIVFLIIGFYSLMYEGLADLKIPVLFYVVAIGLMGILAVNRNQLVNNKPFWFTTMGAFTFIVSDSIIGYSKFIGSIPFAHTFIMSLYCTAQYLIFKGICIVRK